MPGAAALGDSVRGTHDSYDSGTVTFTGEISGGCSSKVFIEGKPAAYVSSTTSETDSECSGSGQIISGSGKVFIEGHPAARLGDAVTGHKGTGTITSGSGKVTFG